MPVESNRRRAGGWDVGGVGPLCHGVLREDPRRASFIRQICSKPERESGDSRQEPAYSPQIWDTVGCIGLHIQDRRGTGGLLIVMRTAVK
jgi:hypothetical protein